MLPTKIGVIGTFVSILATIPLVYDGVVVAYDSITVIDRSEATRTLKSLEEKNDLDGIFAYSEKIENIDSLKDAFNYYRGLYFHAKKERFENPEMYLSKIDSDSDFYQKSLMLRLANYINRNEKDKIDNLFSSMRAQGIENDFFYFLWFVKADNLEERLDAFGSLSAKYKGFFDPQGKGFVLSKTQTMMNVNSFQTVPVLYKLYLTYIVRSLYDLCMTNEAGIFEEILNRINKEFPWDKLDQGLTYFMLDRSLMVKTDIELSKKINSKKVTCKKKL